MATIKKRTIRWATKDGQEHTAQRRQARYVDDGGQRHSQNFELKRDAERWLDEQTAKLVAGTHIAPRDARTTVGEWCDIWIAGYRTRRASTGRQAEVHLLRIKAEFGRYQLVDVRPSQVRAWCAKLKAEGLSDSYVYALHSRLGQVYADAIHDGLCPRSPCSRRTSPREGKQRPYVATTEQLWSLYDAVPEHLGAAVLLGGLVGLRLGEACGLRIGDVDFMRGIVHPAVQNSASTGAGRDLKTDTARTSIPIPSDLALELSRHLEATSSLRRPGVDTVLIDQWGDGLAPWTLERAIRTARSEAGLPETFRFHDLRHYLASMLIASGADAKVVQARLRHASAKTTLDTYAHLWPDSDESSKSAVAGSSPNAPPSEPDHQRKQPPRLLP